MEIRRWRAFSSNNSTSHRLVARFANAELAKEAAEDLQAFVKEAMPIAGRRVQSTATSFPATERMDELASQHGFDWSQLLDAYDGEDTWILAEGSDVVIYNDYCLGLGKALPAYLKARGADESKLVYSREPTVSILYRSTGASIELPRNGARFDDGTTAGICTELDPQSLEDLKKVLREAGATVLRIRICEDSDIEKFTHIAAARSACCDTSMLFLDRFEHDIASDQLACRTCGGMFALSLSSEPSPSRGS